jgi:hypothetical protein
VSCEREREKKKKEKKEKIKNDIFRHGFLPPLSGTS